MDNLLKTMDPNRSIEAAFRQLFDAHPLPMWVFDLETLAFLEVNRAAERQYGYTHDEFLRMTLEDIRPPEQVERLRQYLRQTWQDVQHAGQWIHRRKDGTLIDVEITWHTVEYAQRPGGVVVAQDITERKQAEAALRLSEERYRAIVEDQTEMICRFTPDFRLTFVNRAYSAAFSSTPEAMLGRNLFDFISQEDYEHVRAHIAQITPANPVAHSIHRTLLPDGSARWVRWIDRAVLDDAGQIAEYQGVGRDITEQFTAQESLRSSEEKYRSLVESLDSILGIVDADGRLVYVNEIAARQLGSTPGALIGQTLHNLFPPATADVQLEYARQVITTGKGIVLDSQMGLPGKERWYHSSIQPVRSAAGKPIAALLNATDITALKQIEQTLQWYAHRLEGLQEIDRAILSARSEETIANAALSHLRALIPCGRGAVVTLDFDAQTATILAQVGEAHLMLTSRQTFPLTDRDILRILSENRFALLRNEEIEHYPHQVMQALYRAGIRSILSVGLKSSGQLIGMLNLHATDPDFFTDEHIQIAIEIADQIAVGLHAAMLRRQTEQYTQKLELRVVERTAELAHAKTRVEAILNSSTDSIVLVDIEYGIQQNNLAFNALFACHDDAYFGQPLSSLAHPDDHASLESAIQATIKENAVQRVEIRAVRMDGTIFDAELGLAFVRQLKQEGNHLVCNIRDITARKQSEAALRQALLREKELNELKSRFVSMASHEFRTPLATIQAVTDTIRTYRAKMDDNQIDRKLEKIHEQVDHMKDIMEDVLQLTRIQAGRVEYAPTELDFAELCQSIVDEFSGRPEHIHNLHFACPARPIIVQFDRKLMRRTVNNLVANAIKYSPDARDIYIDLTCSESQVVLRVRDEGIGIPQEDIPSLFHPFHRAGNVGAISGTGLGLSIAREAVELHGGNITVESEVGHGSTFIVTLPIVHTGDHHGENSGD